MIRKLFSPARSALRFFALFVISPGLVYAEKTAADFLIGNWKSNSELSFPTVKLKVEMTPERKEMWKSLFGHLQINYTSTGCSSVRPPRPSLIPGGEPFKEFKTARSYVVVSATANQVVIRSLDLETKKEETETLTFEGPDRYWIRLPTPEGREYFDRVKLAESTVSPREEGRKPEPESGVPTKK